MAWSMLAARRYAGLWSFPPRESGVKRAQNGQHVVSRSRELAFCRLKLWREAWKSLGYGCDFGAGVDLEVHGVTVDGDLRELG